MSTWHVTLQIRRTDAGWTLFDRDTGLDIATSHDRTELESLAKEMHDGDAVST